MRSFAVLSVLLPLVAAHYAIFSPAPRDGTDEQTELIAPCGGLRLGARSNFPIKGGVITGDLAHPTATASFSIVVSETDPAPSQFGQVFVGPPPMSVLTLGSFSVPIDLSSIPQCVDGAAVTFQVVMQTADGTLYTCLDVRLVGDKPSSLPPASTAPSASSESQPDASASAPTSQSETQNTVSSAVVTDGGKSKSAAVSTSVSSAPGTAAATTRASTSGSKSAFAITPLLFLWALWV